MSWLYALETLRHAAPWLAAIFSLVTNLGGEAVFFAVGLYLLWCVDKREGFYVLSVSFLGTVVNQTLKILCRIPRPWVRDPHFTIWEGARAEAAGYSFPSGHSQNAVGTFGSLALWHRKRRAALIVFPILISLVVFSRMFLGVHTPADVFVGAGISLALVFLVYPVFSRDRGQRALIAWVIFLLLVSLSYLLFVLLFRFPADTDRINLAEARKNGWSLVGSVAGMLCFALIEPRFIRYKTEAPLPAQIVKLLGGLALALGLKEGLKPLFALLFGDALFLNAIRYFLVVSAAGLLWPLTFPYLSKIGAKRSAVRKPGSTLLARGIRKDISTKNETRQQR